MSSINDLNINILRDNFKDYRWSDISDKTPDEIFCAIQLCWKIPNIALLIRKNENNKSIFGKFFMEELKNNKIPVEIDVLVLNRDNYMYINKKSKHILYHLSKNLFSIDECLCIVCSIDCNESSIWTCSECTTNVCKDCVKNIVKTNDSIFKCPICKIDHTIHLTKSELNNIIKKKNYTTSV